MSKKRFLQKKKK